MKPPLNRNFFDYYSVNRCECGNCQFMPTEAESICCQEIAEMGNKMDEEDPSVSCITLHPGFASVCLDRWVLQTAYYQMRQHYGDPENSQPVNQ